MNFIRFSKNSLCGTCWVYSCRTHTHTHSLTHTHTHRILPMVIVTWRAMVMKTTNPRSSQTVFDLQISRTRIVF